MKEAKSAKGYARKWLTRRKGGWRKRISPRRAQRSSPSRLPPNPKVQYLGEGPAALISGDRGRRCEVRNQGLRRLKSPLRSSQRPLAALRLPGKEPTCVGWSAQADLVYFEGVVSTATRPSAPIRCAIYRKWRDNEKEFLPVTLLPLSPSVAVCF